MCSKLVCKIRRTSQHFHHESCHCHNFDIICTTTRWLTRRWLSSQRLTWSRYIVHFQKLIWVGNLSWYSQMGISSEFLRRRVLSAITALAQGEDSARTNLEGAGGSLLHQFLLVAPPQGLSLSHSHWSMPHHVHVFMGVLKAILMCIVQAEMNDCRFNEGSSKCTFRGWRKQGSRTIGTRGHRSLRSCWDFPVRRVRCLPGAKGIFQSCIWFGISLSFRPI